jgi:osmotically-inducible protein OsmY
MERRKAFAREAVALVLVAAFLPGCDRSQEDKAAENAAQAVRSANQALNKAEAVAREGLQGAEQLARKAGDAAKDGAHILTDGALTARVKTALLADDAVPGSSIDVDTQGGVVTLTGQVSNPAQAERAVSIARSIEGVQRVENRLTTRGAG